MNQGMRSKIIVLDDDPTGSQTVHGCLLLTRWDVATLKQGLTDASPLFFVLTNTRGMSAARAADVTRTVCRNLHQALDELQAAGDALLPVVVSRSDSTLRGHYPVETDIINAELGPFDAHFLVPAFFEGGRITRNGTHYLMVNGEPVPVHQTEFARDSVFGYQNSYLPAYVEEKTAGRIRASAVRLLDRQSLLAPAGQPLADLHDYACVVVDAETADDLQRFAAHVRAAVAQGKRLLFRSAASLLTALADLPPQPVAAADMRRFVRGNKPGAVIVGSHVPTTTRQLEALLREPGVTGIMVDVNRIADDRDHLLVEVLTQAQQVYDLGQSPVIYTSRTEKTFADQSARLAFGEQVSALLMDIVRGLPSSIGYLVSKGGITSNDVLSDGLALAASRVVGQILAGCSVVRCPDDHPRYPGLPVVIFPGNVGDANALVTVWQRLSAA